MTEWLTGTLVATSALILLVLLVREPVRRTFGARVAYGLWLIPAARLLMPTLTQTIERPMGPAVTPGMFTGQASAEPLLLSSVALPEPSLIEQAGGWPTILMVLWLGVFIAIGIWVSKRRVLVSLLAWLPVLLWIVICEFYLYCAVTGYLGDISHFVLHQKT